MKKILILFSLFVMSFSLVACGRTSTSNIVLSYADWGDQELN